MRPSFLLFAFVSLLAACGEGRSLVTLTVTSPSLAGIDHLRVSVTDPAGRASQPIVWSLEDQGGQLPPDVVIPLGFDRHADGDMTIDVVALSASNVTLASGAEIVRVRPSHKTTARVELPGTSAQLDLGGDGPADLAAADDLLAPSPDLMAPAGLVATPLELVFGGVLVATDKVNSVLLENAGNVTTAALTATLVGPGATGFDVRANGCATLAPTASCTITIGFAPTTEIAYDATLVVSDGGSFTTMIPLSGTGQATASMLVIAPTDFSYTATDVSNTTSKTFLVTNDGTATSGTITATVTGADVAEFSVNTAATTCATLAPMESCDIVVDFSPSHTGASAATLELKESPGGVITAALTGLSTRVPVKVVVAGVNGASGSVSSEPTGISNCFGTCTTMRTTGDVFTLTATPNTGSYLQDFSANCPTSGQSCSLTIGTTATTVDVAFTPPNLVFVTSASYTIAGLKTLGGGSITAGADAACSAEANKSGEFVAFVGDRSLGAAGNPFTRMGTGSGWVRPDGLPFARSQESMKGGEILYPSEQLVNGTPVVATGGDVLTGVFEDGSPSYDCTGWTSTSSTDVAALGDLNAGAGGWSWTSGKACNNLGGNVRLYCFQKTYRPVMPALTAPASARRLFLTRRSWEDVSAGVSPASTMGTMDSFCAEDAAVNDLPGTYLAVIASTSTSAASRFATLPAVPLIRTDNVAVLSDASQFFSGTKLRAAPSGYADGTFSFATQILTGAATLTTNGSAPTTCNAWTDHSGANQETLGRSDSSRADFFGAAGLALCSTSYPAILCLQATD